MIRSSNLNKFDKYISKKSKVSSDILPLKDVKGYLLFTECDKANILNDSFVSNCTVDDGTFPSFPTFCPKVPFQDLTSFSTIHIFRLLQKLKNNFSAGPDGLPLILFKQLARSLAYLCYVYVTYS